MKDGKYARGRPPGSTDSRERHAFRDRSTSISRAVTEFFDLLYHDRIAPKKVCTDSGVSLASLSNYKYGRSLPSIQTMSELGEAAGYELKWVKKGVTDAAPV